MKALVLGTVITLIFALIIFGLLVKPQRIPIFIPSGKGQTNKTCLREKTSCNKDSDCANVCSEGEEVVCMRMPNIPELTETQKKLLNMTGNGSLAPSGYCVKAPSSELQCTVCVVILCGLQLELAMIKETVLEHANLIQGYAKGEYFTGI